MPGVSTITRSKPAALVAAMTSERCSGSSCAPRVARLRKNTRSRSSPGPSRSRLFIRIRSPRRAPPPLRRVGSTASTATRTLSCWSIRRRRTSSSVSELLPLPPVPVMPSTGTCWPVEPVEASRSLSSVAASTDPASMPVIIRASAVRSPERTSSAATPRWDHRSTSQSRTIELIIPGRPIRCPSSGEKIVTPEFLSRSISSCTITPPPPPTTLTWPAPRLRSSSTRYSKYSTCPPW